VLARWVVLVAVALFAVGVPLLPSNSDKVDVTVLSGLLLTVGYYGRLRAGERLGRTALDVPAATFLVVAGLATGLSPSPFVSFFPSLARGDGFLVYIVYVVMALAAARLGSREIRRLLTALVAGGAVISAIAIGQYYGHDVSPWLGYRGLTFERSWGTLGNADFLGGYVALVLPLGLALAAQEVRPTWWGWAGASVLLYAALIGSETRSAWAAVAVAAVLLVRFLPAVPRTYRRLALYGLVCAVVTVVMMHTRSHGELAARAASALDPADSSMRGRLYVWSHTLPLIWQRPVFGWGFSQLLGRLPGLGSPEYFRVFGRQLVLIDTPHNDTLYFAFHTGLAGLAAYLWIWLTAFRGLGDALRSAGSGIRLAVGLMSGFVAYLIWLQLAWSHIGPANVAWVLIGISVALGCLARESAAGSHPDPAK